MRKHQYQFASSDTRGKHIQIAQGKWKQLNYLEILKDKERGGHYHKNNRELFFIVEGIVELKLSKNGKHEVAKMEAGDVFEIKPYETHTVKGLADVSKIVILHSRVFDEKNPDIHKGAL